MAGNGNNVKKTGLAIALILLSVFAFVFFILMERNENKKIAEQLAEIAKQQNLEKKTLIEKVSAEYDVDAAVVAKYLPGIVCWGDSLTAGAGGNGVTYPKALEAYIRKEICNQYSLISQLSGEATYLIDASDYEIKIPVVNMGVGGENTLTISGRNGAIPYVVSQEFTIPKSKIPVEISFTSQNGEKVAPLRQGDQGVNPVVIDGVEGVLSIRQESSDSEEYTYYFTRTTVGDSKSIQPGKEIITAASQENLDYITVIFMGQNGGYTGFEDLIRQQRAIIEHQTANKDRYIIVGLHTGTAESRNALETALENEYGAHYINLREYMSTQAMTDAGLIPTDADIEKMQMGATPDSLLTDVVHFNSVGYELVGKLIYKRMDELGYFNEVREALAHNFE